MLKGAWPNTLVMHTSRVIFMVINATITTKRTIMLQHKISFGCDCVDFITTVDNMLSLCTLDAWSLETVTLSRWALVGNELAKAIVGG